MSCGSNFQPHTSCRASRLLLPHPPRQRKGPSDLPLGNRERLASARSARGGTRAHRGGSRHQVATERDIRGDAPCCLTTASRCFVPVTTFHEIPGDRRLATSVADEPRDHTRRGQLSVRAPLERLSPAPAWRASATTHTTTAADRAAAPVEHRLDNPLAGPTALSRAGAAALAVGVSVALAVARLRVGAATAAHADIAGLDRPCLLPGQVLSA